MSLETGYYFLYAFDLDQRPLGVETILCQPNEQVVVEEHITVPHKWHLEHLGGSKYIITSDNRPVENVDGDVQVIISSGVPIPFYWAINAEIGAAPSKNLFRISVAAEDKHWFIDVPQAVDQSYKAPVKVIDSCIASPILIVPAE